jgi:hypothetical protein
MHKKSQIQKINREFSRIFTVQHRKQFQDSNIPKSYLAQIRGFSWHNAFELGAVICKDAHVGAI